MTGEQVIQRVYDLFNHYRATYNENPKFVYISSDLYYEVKRTDYFSTNCLNYDGTVQMFGMKPVELCGEKDFIRLGV